MGNEKKSTGPFGSPVDAPVRGADLDELYRRLQPAGRRSKANPPDGVAEALEAAERIAAEMDAEDTANEVATDLSADAAMIVCGACGYRNRTGNKFCGMCGAVITETAASPALPGVPSSHAIAPSSNMFMQPEVHPSPARGAIETHHYHHHYHHHYFNGAPEGGLARASSDTVREDKIRPNPAMRGDMSRAEAEVRRVTQEWVLACNTKHLDDLMDLYASDALVLRSNYPPIRGAAAVREFFFGALEAGLGEVEVEPLRVDIVGDLAYEAGRCKALAPSSTGKRREERGKYLWVFSRQSASEWKLVADCWSSDLTLTTLESEVPAHSGVKTNPPRKNS